MYANWLCYRSYSSKWEVDYFKRGNLRRNYSWWKFYLVYLDYPILNIFLVMIKWYCFWKKYKLFLLWMILLIANYVNDLGIILEDVILPLIEEYNFSIIKCHDFCYGGVNCVFSMGLMFYLMVELLNF